jgi:cytochrome P450
VDFDGHTAGERIPKGLCSRASKKRNDKLRTLMDLCRAYAVELLAGIGLLLYISITILWTLFVSPHLSPLRHLPQASQKPLLTRLFKEPNAFHFEQWINDQQDAELIRYFGFLNRERLLVTRPAAIDQVLRLQANKFEKQHAARTILQWVAGQEAVVVTETDLHRRQRRAMDPAFRLGQIKAVYYPQFWRKAAEMLRVIAQEKTADRIPPHTYCMDDIIGRTVFDIIGQASLSLDWKALSSPAVYWKELSAFRDAFSPSQDNRNRILLSFAFPRWLVDCLPMKFNRMTGAAVRRVRTVCGEHMRQICMTAVKKDEFGICLLLSPLEDQVMSVSQLQDQALMFQSGGSHSSVISLLSAAYLLAQHQEIQDRLRDEIRKYLPPCTEDSSIETDIVMHMPYLNAVRNEVLRLYSAFSWLGRRAIEDVEIHGTRIPAGTLVSLSPWALHRSYRLYGHDAKEFKPERWLSGAPTVPREICSFLSFGAGSRACIGKSFAMAELNCIIAALFGRYRVRFGAGQAIPKVTQQVGVAFRSEMLVELELVEGW